MNLSHVDLYHTTTERATVHKKFHEPEMVTSKAPFPHKQSAVTANRETKHMVFALLVSSDLMSAMLSMFVMLKQHVENGDGIQSPKIMTKWTTFHHL